MAVEPENSGPSGRRRGRGRTASRVAVAASILVHLLALAVLGLAPWVLRSPVRIVDRPVTLYLMPEIAPQRRPAVARARAPIARLRPPRTPSPLPLPAASPVEAAAGPPTIRFFDAHVPDCGREDLLLMTPAERMACEGRIAAARADGYRQWRKPGQVDDRLAFIPDDKRGAYSVEAAANARRRRRYDSDVPMSAPIVPCTGPGSNFGEGCLPDTSMTTVGRH